MLLFFHSSLHFFWYKGAQDVLEINEYIIKNYFHPILGKEQMIGGGEKWKMELRRMQKKS